MNKTVQQTLRPFFVTSVLTLALFMQGCSEISFYSQAISGQSKILWQREPIEDLIAAPSTSAQLKQQLTDILEIRTFAKDQLQLPVDGNYASYVELHRPYVVWNIFSSRELSFEAHRWCYPVIGCQTYRGYYSEQDARDHANRLKEDGWEVWVGGVAAYSTLGWFDDPVLSTFVYRERDQLAALLFHELAHHIVYVDGDTAFNESFATSVERNGLALWLAHQNEAHRMADYQRRKKRQQAFIELVQSSSEALRTLYASDAPDAEKRQQKAVLLQKLKRDYQSLRSAWREGPHYDRWFEGEINNAKLQAVGSYNDLVPAFDKLFEKHQADWAAFFAEVKTIAALPKEARLARLKAL